MYRLLRILSRLINLGTQHSEDLHTKHRIRFVNKMQLVGFFSILLFAVHHYFRGVTLGSLVLFLNSALIIYCFHLMKKGFNNLAPFLALVSASTSIFLNGYFIIGDHGVQYILLSLTPLAALAIDQKKKLTMLFTMFFIPFLGTMVLILDIPKYGFYELSDIQLKILLTMCYTEGFGLIFFQAYAFLFEMEKRYNVYLANQTKIENQTRLSDLGLMTAGIAHEINNPLAVINGSSIFLLKKLEKGNLAEDEIKKELNRMLGQSDRIIKIIKGLKFVSRDGSRDPFELESVNKVIEEAYELCESKLKSFDVEASFNYGQSECFANIRAVQIQQVVLSLVSNAIDAIQEQEFKRIEISLDCEGPKNIKVMIRDNGPGIPKDLREQVLKPFFTTKPVGKGTGLGLSVASEIMQKHGGSLEILDSESGACFVLKIPKAESEKLAA